MASLAIAVEEGKAGKVPLGWRAANGMRSPQPLYREHGY
jgi:hypothetical protein